MSVAWQRRGVFAWGVVCLAGVACNPTVEEPAIVKAPPSVTTAPTAPITPAPKETARATAPTAAPGSAEPPAPPRCIRPQPEKPARTLASPGPDPRCPRDPGPVPQLALAAVRFPEAKPGTPELGVEVARADHERQRGLMFRTSLGEAAGMLFVFERERPLAFWMKNTCIPLDMIFVAADGVIVGIEENVPTLNEDTYSPGCPAQYVIEVRAGWARDHGVAPGQRVTLPPL